MAKLKPNYKQRVLDSLPCVLVTIVKVCNHDQRLAYDIIEELTKENKIKKTGVFWRKL